jgi:5'-nucleotidase
MKEKKNIRIYVDMDNVLCDYDKAFNRKLREQPEIAYPQSQYGFFLDLEEIFDACDYFALLSKRFDVWILTAPSIQNPMCYTEKRIWVEKHLGYKAAEKLILSPDKSLLKGDYLIDDMVEGRAKQSEFEGTQIVFGSEEFPDWYTVYNYFKKYW